MQELNVSRLWKMGAVATVGMVFGSGCVILDLIASLLGDGLGGLDLTSLLGGLLGGGV